MKLSHRLLAVVALALIPLSALQVRNAFQREAQQTEQTYEEARRLLRLIEDEQAGNVLGIRQTLGTLRQTEAIVGRDVAACQGLMDRLRNEYPPYLDIQVTNAKGVITCATDRRAVGVDVSDRPHVREVLAGNDFFIGGSIKARTTGLGVLPFSLGYRDQATGGIAGAIIAGLDIAWLETYFSSKALPPTVVLTVADRDGTIIARVPDLSAPGQPDGVGASLSNGYMALFNRSGSGVERVGGPDGSVRMVAFSPIDDRVEGLFLSVGIDEVGALEQIHRTRNGALAVLVAIALFTVASVLLIGRRYVQEPAERLAAAADRWRAGDFSLRIFIPSSAREFAALAEDFNGMADALEARDRALKASEGQHRAVFETAVDAMVVIDDKGVIQTSNPAAAKTFGYDAAELKGRNVSMLMGEEHGSRHDGYLRNYLQTGVRRIIGVGREVEGRRSDGSVFPLELAIAEWRGPDDNLYFTGIMRNISARRAAEREVEEERSRLRSVIENAPFPAIVHGDDGEVLHISRAWLDITGYTREQLPTIEAWSSLAYGDSRNDLRVATKAGVDHLYSLDRSMDEGEYVILTAEGNKRIWAFRSSPVGGDMSGRRLVVSMAADITERRDGEERLKLLMREVDHRAKNALMVVQSIVQLSRSEDPAQFSMAVEGRIQAMARAHSLLAAARWSGADLQHLLTEELAAYGGDGKVVVDGPPISIRPEATQAVSLALHELTTNAAKHGALSTDTGQVRVTWTLPEAETELSVDWSETGGPEISGQPSRGGFGSVLLRQVVEAQLGGELRLTWSSAGLSCVIRLPGDTWQASGVRMTAPAASAPLAPVTTSHAGRRVLVVEDEALTAMALQLLLEDAGYIVLGPVGRVEDALDLLRSGPPDAAVLDVNLFGATVDPVASRLEDMGVPFLFCTGYHSGGTAGERHPTAPVLGKPVNANSLLAAVSGLMSAEPRAVATAGNA
ncbi:hypothetical protein N825_09800 [Skermanella stibiiresistens SB22]|uniref:Sensor protein FixL n=1 Tax=Skermanella stibiiresistens SB22 TaxID=1385369 RepID=W9GRT6_9PROT|nr:PAS domain S-box protein [Skermanella stibiiresistens]EWY36605.1 hypothetical protein N825_09800 [Skermanella stibiiresistens SB22]